MIQLEEVCVKQAQLWLVEWLECGCRETVLPPKPGSWPSILLRKEMRGTLFSPSSPASETILGEKWDLPETDTSSDYAMTFPAWWKSTSLPAQLYPWKEDSWRQPSAREIDALCLLWKTASFQTCLRHSQSGICSWRMPEHKDCVPPWTPMLRPGVICFCGLMAIWQEIIDEPGPALNYQDGLYI